MPLAPIWRRSLRIAGNDTSGFFTLWASFPWSRKSSLWNSFDRQKGDDRLPCRPSSKTNKTGPAFSSRLPQKLKKSQRSGFDHFRETNWKSVVWIFLSPPWNSGTHCFPAFLHHRRWTRKSLQSLQFFRGRYQVWKKSYLNEEFFLDSWVWSARLSRFWHIEKSWIWNMINFSKSMVNEEFKYEEKNCHWNKNLVKNGC